METISQRCRGVVMQPIPLEPGMRVRCIRADHYAEALTLGASYTVLDFDSCVGASVQLSEKPGYHFFPDRFKPIVRVKAPTSRVIANGPFAGMNEAEALDLVMGGY